MDKVLVQLKNHAHLQVNVDRGIGWELREQFSFFVPGYEWMPAYRNKVWDGKIRLYDYTKGTIPVGLYPRLQAYCTKMGYALELEKSDFGLPFEREPINVKEIWDFFKGLNLQVNGKPIEIRDYQFNAICKAIETKRILLLSPTGSGKSLIIYCLLRWWQARRDDKFLVIVPTTSLVEQMYSDFKDYSSQDPTWNVENECHKIYSGKEKTNVHEKIFISTWQSIYKLPKTWFNQFGTIFGDEAHLFTAKSLNASMDKAENAENRVGTTGTLDGTKTHQMVLEGVFGPVTRVTTTKKLQDSDTLAQLDIKVLKLIYPEELRKSFGKVKYQSEVDWVVRNEARNKFIRNLAIDLDGNTLIMFQFVDKHGKILYDMIKDKADHRVFFVAGETDKYDREAIRKIVETQKKSTIVASLGVFSTGVNIRNIHNLIFASPSKSQIKVLQSIGRGLRKSDNGQDTTLLDIVDDLSWGARKNYCLKHGEERMKIYQEEQFDFKVHKVQFK